MEEIEARYKKEAAEERLLMGLGTLRALIDGPADRRPEAKLRRELSGARMLWDKFDMMHFAYMRVLLLEQNKVIEREAFKESYETAHGIFEQVEELLDALAPAPAAVPPRQFIGNDILYAIAKQEQESFYGNATEKVDSVETCLAPAADEGAVRSEYRQELEQLGKELDQSEEHMKAAAMLTKEMNKLTPREAAENIRQEAETVRELSKKIDKQRRAIARKLATVAVPEAAGGTGKNKMGSDTYMYTRRPMPKFDGQKRNYPAFRREWQTCITGRFDADYEVREIKLNVPAEVEPDIKNLTTMAGVWSVLDARYGKVMELTKELISGLQCFAFSRQATNDSAKFLELHNEFVKVYNDLEQIDRLSVLNHEPTLCTLAKQLPSDDSKMRYTKLRLRRLEENDEAVARVLEGAEPVGVLSNLDIMNEFMRKEREIQVSFGQLLSTETSRSKPVDSSRNVDRVQSRGGSERRCFKCDKPGHQARDCPSQAGRRVPYNCNCFRCGEPGHESAECTLGQDEGGGGWNAREANANTSIKPKDCPACKQQHCFTAEDGSIRYKCRLSCCEVFREDLGPSERTGLLEKVNGCAVCTDWTGSHRREQCVEKTHRGARFGSCPVQVGGNRCGKRHHSLLHGNSSKFANFVAVNMVRKSSQRGPPTEEDMEAADSVTALCQVQYVETDSEAGQAIVFWDCGSNVCLVTAEFARRSGWIPMEVTLRMQTTGRKADTMQTRSYWVLLVNTEGETERVLAYEMPSITAPLGRVDVSAAMKVFPQLKNIAEVARPEGAIDILIGIQYAGMHPAPQCADTDVRGDLRLLTSRFGTGRLLDGQHPDISVNVMMKNPQAHALGKRDAFKPVTSRTIKESNRINKVKGFTFPECEEMGTSQPRRCGSCTNCQKCSEAKVQLSRKEQEELTLIESSMVLDEDTKQVRMRYPFIRDPSVLGDNRKQVIAMAKNLEGRLRRAGQLEAYNAEVEGYVHRAVFKELSEEEMSCWAGVVNYISHHDVPKPGSTTALRIVSNSSLANPVTGVSYNDILPKGPNALVPLFEALIRWRSYEKTVVWDLRKAYNTVVTYQEEMHARRLVWRWGIQGDAWTTYGIDRMHFGDRPAMCGLSVGLRMTAEAGSEIDPEAASMIKLGYVDDGVGGGDQATVNRLIGEERWTDGKPFYDGTVQKILNKGSFEVKVMVQSGETRKEVIDLLGGSVLGLPWTPSTDKITMHMGVNLSARKKGVRVGIELSRDTIGLIDQTPMTKRVLVSQVYGIFDPLGLLTPITIKFKLFLQKLSNNPGGWDEEVSEELAEEGRLILKEMVLAPDIEVPRSFRPEGVEQEMELIGFWDGGDPASTGCVYSRHEKEKQDEVSGQTHEVRLVAGKARVTPSPSKTSKKSTPRTELRGLVILTRLISSVVHGLPTAPVRISLNGDSECTISAVESEDGVLETWFSNRVAEVLGHMEAWSQLGIQVDPLMHWPGLRNIADIGTKGKATLADLGPSSEWLNGPRELSQPRETWPASREFRRSVPKEETRCKAFNSNAVVQEQAGARLRNLVLEVMARHNSFDEVKRILARWLWASVKGERERCRDFPKVKFLALAEKLMFLIDSSNTGEEIKKHNSRLTNLSPMWSKGRWVTKGRLGKGMFKVLGVEELPVLVPTSRLAELVMLRAHNYNHKSVTITLWTSRSDAWVLQGRRLAKRASRSCVECKSRWAKTVEQRMGDLPEERLDVGGKPFTFISLDLMGPVFVKAMVNKRTQMKVYPMVLVCQATGALHTEVVHAYSTAAFLLAFDHYTSVRGYPTKVYSDKGSQFTSSGNVVAFGTEKTWGEVEEAGARQGTTWEFAPAGAQHRNGLAEARVKAVKVTFNQTLSSTIISGKPTLNFAELQSFLSQVANIVNDRPLFVKELREDEPIVPITVNQLLIGKTSTVRSNAEDLEVGDFKACSAYADHLLDTWWSHWKQQGFASLLPYPELKHAKRHKNLQVGDVCLIYYDNKVKGTYRLCIVLEVIESRDNIVRTVKVGFRPRRHCGPGRYKPVPLDNMTVAVQRLVLLVESEESGAEKQAGDSSEEQGEGDV